MFKYLMQSLLLFSICIYQIKGRKLLFVNKKNSALSLLLCRHTVSQIACGHLCLLTTECIDFNTTIAMDGILQCCLFEDQLSPFGARICTGRPVAIGMEAGVITNAQITASSELDLPFINPNYAHKGRLNMDSIWCSESLSSDPNPYIEIDMGSLKTIVAVASQGNPGLPLWVVSYLLFYKQTDGNWHKYKENGNLSPKIFRGNADQETVVKNFLDVPVLARHVRFMHVTSFGVMGYVCMRVEVYTFEDACL